MDPVSSVSTLVGVLGLCAEAIEQLKKFWNAGKDLRTLMAKVGRAQRAIESILVVVRELKAAGLESLEFSFDVFINLLRDVVQKILRRVEEVVATERGKPRPKFIQKLLWTLSRDKMDALEEELKDLEYGMADQVNAVNLLATLKHLSIVRAETLGISSTKYELHDAFSEPATLVDHEGEANDDHVQVTRTWLGNLDADKHDEEYVQRRGQLADAAKYAMWDEVFDLLECGRNIYGESWINAPRIKRGEELNMISLWTPLHQAVYMDAPVEIVTKLLRLGASKTLRTRWTEFPWADMTPLELAQHLGVQHLIEILHPVIQVPIPTDTLTVLQKQFHELVKRDMGERFKDEEWWLPQLETLLEFEAREWTWFPIDFSENPRITGYWYRLDCRDLLVRSDNTAGKGTKQGYRIAVDGIFEIEQAMVSWHDFKLVDPW